MHWTGHTSTHARSLVPRQASVMMAMPLPGAPSHCGGRHPRSAAGAPMSETRRDTDSLARRLARSLVHHPTVEDDIQGPRLVHQRAFGAVTLIHSLAHGTSSIETAA